MFWATDDVRYKMRGLSPSFIPTLFISSSSSQQLGLGTMSQKPVFVNPLDCVAGYKKSDLSDFAREVVCRAVWDTVSWKDKPDHKRLRAHHESMHFSCMALSPDGSALATGSADGTFMFWRLHDFWLAGAFKVRPITALAFAPDGTSMFVGCQNGDLVHVDVVRCTRAVISGHIRSAITVLAYNDSGDHLAVGTVSNGFYVYRVSGRTELDLLYRTARPSRITAIAWRWLSTKVQQCRTVEGNRSFHWTAGAFQKGPLELTLGPEAVSAYVRHPKGFTVLGSPSGHVQLYHSSASRDATPGPGPSASRGMEFGRRFGAPVAALACSPDGKSIAAGFNDGNVRVLDAQELKVLAEYRFAKVKISSLAIAHAGDAHRIVCLYEDGTVCMKEVRDFCARKSSSLATKFGF